MEFVLNEYHRNTSDEELIADVKRVASLLQQESLTQKEYKQHGAYNPATIARRFGTWNDALKKAGLVLERVKLYKQHKYCESDEAFFEDIRRVAQQLGKSFVSRNEYEEYGVYASGIRQKKYKGWNGLLKAAGLEPTPFRTGPNRKYTNKEIFEEIERVWILLGRQPKYIEARDGGLFRFSETVLCNHFGCWRKALEAFVAYINSDDDNDKDSQTEPTETIEPMTTNAEGIIIRHKTNRNINLRMRFRVMARDHFKCCKCGKSPATDPTVILHIDHIYPWAKGGETVMENLQTLCSECNLGKSDLLIDNGKDS